MSAITLKPLPYALDALEPYISKKTMSFHYEKHHGGYISKLDELLKSSPLAGKSLEEIILQSHEKQELRPLFNNAAQVWNHTFYWESMKPGGGGLPPQKVLQDIEKSFGSFEDFKKNFKEAALSQFGSGWAWVVRRKDSHTLSLLKTSNAETPLTDPALVPLLTCDVWEHAYYLDYQNRRAEYVDLFLDHLVDWHRF